jgi:hypothetical protein
MTRTISTQRIALGVLDPFKFGAARALSGKKPKKKRRLTRTLFRVTAATAKPRRVVHDECLRGNSRTPSAFNQARIAAR